VSPSASDDLTSTGWHVRDGFVAAADVAALRASAELRAARGEFRPAKIGAGNARQARTDLRGDYICWWQAPLLPAEIVLNGALNALRNELNRELSLGLFETELHYARYAPGAAYARHSDQPHGSRDRVATLVIYLNQAWCAADGGQLRLYIPPQNSRDVMPVGGRLVLFMSEGREHEVLPATRERLSVTGWLRRRDTATR
jgi:SM-20-related protein